MMTASARLDVSWVGAISCDSHRRRNSRPDSAAIDAPILAAPRSPLILPLPLGYAISHVPINPHTAGQIPPLPWTNLSPPDTTADDDIV